MRMSIHSQSAVKHKKTVLYNHYICMEKNAHMLAQEYTNMKKKREWHRTGAQRNLTISSLVSFSKLYSLPDYH